MLAWQGQGWNYTFFLLKINHIKLENWCKLKAWCALYFHLCFPFNETPTMWMVDEYDETKQRSLEIRTSRANVMTPTPPEPSSRKSSFIGDLPNLDIIWVTNFQNLKNQTSNTWWWFGSKQWFLHIFTPKVINSRRRSSCRKPSQASILSNRSSRPRGYNNDFDCILRTEIISLQNVEHIQFERK